MRSLKYVLFFVLISLATSGCMFGYVFETAHCQLDMLNSRQPIEEVLSKGLLPKEQAAKLALVPEIKKFGENLGLSPTKNYDTYTVGWDQTLWNFSACKPLAFENKTWRFPVAGNVPYLWFYTKEDAKPWVEEYEAEGWDVWLRTSRAYSTGGWFRDPVTPAILRSDEFDLAEVISHELAHSTIIVKNHTDFTETFASVVGEEIADRWMVARYGADSEQVRLTRQQRADEWIFDQILNGLYNELDAVYRDSRLSDKQKLELKNRLIGSLENRVLNSNLFNKSGYLKYVRREPWNNARLAQYRLYNNSPELLIAYLIKHHGDMRSFIKDLKALVRKNKNPWDALKKAVD